jgi:hypothetical protein
MPLAGKIRLTTFVAILSTVTAAVVGTVAWNVSQRLTSGSSDEAPAGLTASPPQVAAADAVMTPGSADHAALIMTFVGKDLGAPKLQDIDPGGPKINLYQDEGHSSVNRAKVDLDRDDQDDEKWTLADGAITRAISPQDDGTWPIRLTWDGSAWVGEGGAAQPAPAPAAGAGRPVDVDLMTWQGRDLGVDKKKDVTSGKPYKINVYQDAGQATANRAKIDLDRDDKWDEKITFEPTRVTREVAPADDEQYSERYHWDGAGWARAE